MYFEELGKENEKIIVMLHGANFIHTFGMQYPLAEKYHLVIPHIMGYGNNTEHDFETEECIMELADFIRGLGHKVLLVGFSLGAQLAFRLVSEHEELFTGAIIGSPWLIKEEPMLSEMIEVNVKNLALFKKKWLCNIIGMINGLPKKPRREFVEQMQHVTEATMRSTVDNGISFETVSGFTNVSIPVVAIAGGKEQSVVIDSVKRMAELNHNCRYEIWKNAAHNAPLHGKRFNKLIEDMINTY